MRSLTAKQKGLLKKYVKENIKDLNYSCEHYSEMPEKLYEQIKAINDTEILWSNVNRYINDLIASGEFKQNIGVI